MATGSRSPKKATTVGGDLRHTEKKKASNRAGAAAYRQKVRAGQEAADPGGKQRTKIKDLERESKLKWRKKTHAFYNYAGSYCIRCGLGKTAAVHKTARTPEMDTRKQMGAGARRSMNATRSGRIRGADRKTGWTK
jgi:hypothetical protein